jgi:hypothetical protein
MCRSVLLHLPLATVFQSVLTRRLRIQTISSIKQGEKTRMGIEGAFGGRGFDHIDWSCHSVTSIRVIRCIAQFEFNLCSSLNSSSSHSIIPISKTSPNRYFRVLGDSEHVKAVFVQFSNAGHVLTATKRCDVCTMIPMGILIEIQWGRNYLCVSSTMKVGFPFECSFHDLTNLVLRCFAVTSANIYTKKSLHHVRRITSSKS